MGRVTTSPTLQTKQCGHRAEGSSRSDIFRHRVMTRPSHITRPQSPASGKKTWKWKSFNETMMTGCLLNDSTKLISIS